MNAGPRSAANRADWKFGCSRRRGRESCSTRRRRHALERGARLFCGQRDKEHPAYLLGRWLYESQRWLWPPSSRQSTTTESYLLSSGEARTYTEDRLSTLAALPSSSAFWMSWGERLRLIRSSCSNMGLGEWRWAAGSNNRSLWLFGLIVLDCLSSTLL